MYLLELHEVTKNYASKLALDSASLNIPKASVFGLLGPNGAGKTTLIRIITHITAADSGTVKYNGEHLQSGHSGKIGYLPEERGLYKKMQVFEQGIYFAMLKGLSKKDAIQRLDYWFHKFDIGDWKKKKIEELSKGMQQKVQFIFTVLHEPELIILDEPFTGFDPVNAELIKNEVLALKAAGATIVLSTHRMETVEELCDEIAFINNGRIVLNGEINFIKNTYKENKLEIETTGKEISLPSGFSLVDSKMEKNGRYLHMLQVSEQLPLNDALKKLLQQNELYAFREVLPSMSEIFLKLARA